MVKQSTEHVRAHPAILVPEWSQDATGAETVMPNLVTKLITDGLYQLFHNIIPL